MPSQGDSPDLQDLRARICRLVPGWRAADVGDFVYLHDGYSNDNYRFRRGNDQYVLRLPIASRPEAQWRAEQAFYDAPGEILVPDVIAFDVNTGTMVSRWVEGPLLIDSPPRADELVSYLKILHGNLAATPVSYDPIATSRINLQTPGPEQASPLVQRFASSTNWPEATQSSCHNDLNPWNIIRARAGAWVTLDWESHGNNDPLFDLVTLHQGLDFADELLPQLGDALLDATTPTERIEQNLIGFWVREYAWAFAQWQHGNHRDELREQMDRAEAKLRTLR